MSYLGQEAFSRKPNVVWGMLLTAAVHAALVLGAVFLHKNPEVEPEIRFQNIIEAKIVRLGKELDERELPRLEAPPAPPPPDPGVKVTQDERVTPEPPRPKEAPKKRSQDLEAQLFDKLLRDRATARRDTASGQGKADVRGGRTTQGDPRGDPEGEVISARDQVQGNLWAGEVKRALHRAWAIPEVIPDSDLGRLAAVVVIRFDEEGNIRSWTLRTPASGSSFASLFNGSVKLVFAKVRSLPAPPPGALKMFKGGWLALKFTKAEQEKAR